MTADQELLSLSQVRKHPADLLMNGVTQRPNGANHAGAFAIRARLAQKPFQGLPDSFAGDGNQSKVVELKNLRWRLVLGKLLLKSLHNFLAILLLVHINEVNDDDAAQVTKANLPYSFSGRIQVGLGDGVLQGIGAPDEPACVDIYGNQRLCLIDDDISYEHRRV